VRDTIVLVMALLSFEESTPGAYGLGASNAAPPISTSIGTFPKPIQNALVECFNGRLRDKCLNQTAFRTLADAGR